MTTREILEDRWEGLMSTRRQPLDTSKLQLRLDDLVLEVVTGLARVDPCHETTNDVAFDHVQAIHDDFKASVMRHVEAWGDVRGVDG